MNRRLFLLGTGGMLAGTWMSLRAQPSTEVPPIKPDVNPAKTPKADQGLDKALIDDTDIRPNRVDENEASPSDAPPPIEDEASPSDRIPRADSPMDEPPPVIHSTPVGPPPAHAYPAYPAGGCQPCPPMPCPPQPTCQPMCYPRRRHHHRRRRGC